MIEYKRKTKTRFVVCIQRNLKQIFGKSKLKLKNITFLIKKVRVLKLSLYLYQYVCRLFSQQLTLVIDNRGIEGNEIA